jgi:hypothetical protein
MSKSALIELRGFDRRSLAATVRFFGQANSAEQAYATQRSRLCRHGHSKQW